MLTRSIVLKPKRTNFLYITIKALTPTETENKYISEQVSLLLGKDYLITFEEVDSKAFEQIRERLVKGIGNTEIVNLNFFFIAFWIPS